LVNASLEKPITPPVPMYGNPLGTSVAAAQAMLMRPTIQRLSFPHSPTVSCGLLAGTLQPTSFRAL